MRWGLAVRVCGVTFVPGLLVLVATADGEVAGLRVGVSVIATWPMGVAR